MPKKSAPKTEKVVNTNVYYDEIREDYGRINAVLQAQITKLRRLIERMPLQMRLDLETTNPIAPVYDGYAVINIVNPAIKALHRICATSADANGSS